MPFPNKDLITDTNLLTDFERARSNLESKGLIVKALFVPRNPPQFKHNQLHMEAICVYPDGITDQMFIANQVTTSERAATALATFLLEQWLDQWELYVMAEGEQS